MLRAPMSLAKMCHEAATGRVIYRSKMHLGLNRNFQVMPGAGWLELLCKYIPDLYEQLGARARRARPTRASSRLAAERGHPPHISPDIA
jgi:hypothetical protein